MKKIITLFIVTLLGACGGGGGSSSNSDVKTGQFKDSVVKGLGYSTATQNGITDENGTFKYQLNEIVTFKIGAMEIGSAQGADILYPTHIVETEADAVKIAQVLQTLDKDGDADVEGIDITGQFNEQQTRNQNIADSADLQALIDEIKATTEARTLVNSATAKAHIDATIFADMRPTFESISNQDDIDSRISIDNNQLKLSPQNSNGESVWLLAKTDTATASISADVKHGYEGNFQSMAEIALILELKTTNAAHYFSIGADTFVCPTNFCDSNGESQGALTVVTGGSQSKSSYLGKIIKIASGGYSYEKQENIAPYTGDTLEVVTMDGTANDGYADYEFSIELDKQNQRVNVTKDNLSGYFDISNAVFADLNNASTKFFIEYYSVRENQNISSYVDNVQINNQDFDDFSASTLNPDKWKTGKFLYSGE